MKKITFLVVTLILVSTISVEANNTSKPIRYYGKHNWYNQKPVTFIERNIKFYVYQNGDIDFDLYSYSNGYYGTSDFYYKGKGKHKSKNRSRVKLNSSRHHHSGFIQYDYRGRVKRIGSTHIRYDYFDRVIAINRINIRYRHNRLVRVGGLRIVINRYGHIRFIGSVKPRYYHYNNYHNHYFYDNYVYQYDDDFFYNDEFENEYEYFEEDDDYYYYRSKNKHSKTNRSGKKESKQKIIKRKKSQKNK
jgi:hypothetical protein